MDCNLFEGEDKVWCEDLKKQYEECKSNEEADGDQNDDTVPDNGEGEGENDGSDDTFPDGGDCELYRIVDEDGNDFECNIFEGDD